MEPKFTDLLYNPCETVSNLRALRLTAYSPVCLVFQCILADRPLGELFAAAEQDLPRLDVAQRLLWKGLQRQ